MDFKTQTIRFLFLSLFMSLIVNCSNYYYKLSKTKSFQTKIFLRGPGTCSHLILIDNNGNGKAMMGRTDDYYLDKFNKFESIEIMTNFKIKDKEFNEIQGLITRIKESDKIVGQSANDARRIEIFIDDVKKMDIYTWDSNILNDLIRKLSYHIPYDINSFCDPTTK